MIGTRELDYARQQAAQLLPDLCDLQSVARTSDGAGGYMETWTTYAVDVPCRLAVDRTQAREEVQAGQVTPTQRYWLTLAYDRAIAITDRVVKAGRVFEVAGLDDGKSYAATKRVAVVAK